MKWNEVTRLDKNRAGAWVGKLAGYITRQSHDMYKIRAEGYEGWRDFILPRLDDGTFEGIANREEYLQNVYNNLASGTHLTYKPASEWLKGFKGGGSNIAKRACSLIFSRRAVIFLRHRLFAPVLPQNQILTAHRKYDRIFLVAEHARKFYLLLWLSW